MIKTYTTTVKAEVFDGSDEMMSRYPIRHHKSALYEGGIGYILEVPSRYDRDEKNYFPLRIGQYIVTSSAGRVINMWPFEFYDLFPEAEND